MTTDDTRKSCTAQATAAPARACLLCGQCTAVCPAFLATGQEELSPRAKHLVFAALRDEPERLPLKPARELADRCLSCGRCVAACPQKLSVPEALAALRARHPDWRQWVWKRWIGHGRLLWPALARMGQVSLLVAGGKGSEAAQRMLRSAAAMLPPPPPRPWIVPERPSADAPRDGQRHHEAQAPAMLFAGCTARRIRPRWKDTASALLRWLGHPAPAQGDENAFTCCGSTLEHAGIPDAAAEARSRNLDAWRAAGRPLLVTFCATCHHGLASYTNHDDLQWQEGEREAWQDALRPLTTLWGKAVFRVTEDAPSLPEAGKGPAGNPAPAGLAPIRYHQPCHRPGTDPDAAWLRALLGARLRMPGGPACCGMGGVLQLAAPDLSRTVADACWQGLLPEREQQPAAPGEGATDVTVLTGCSGCALQLAATAPAGVRVLHWLDVTAPPDPA